MSELVRRVAATDQVLRRFRTRAFDWNGATCLHLARAQLLAMGHKPPRIPAFQSMLGAKKAMKRAGFETVADIFDGLHLPRIAPAAMLVGDLAILPGEDGFDAVVICAGGKLLGWHGAGKGGIEPIGEALASVTGAWRL